MELRFSRDPQGSACFFIFFFLFSREKHAPRDTGAIARAYIERMGETPMSREPRLARTSSFSRG